MKRFLGASWIIGVMAMPTLGGTVTLDPAVATVAPGEAVQFTVTISQTDLSDFDAIDLLISSDLENLNLQFVYDAGFITSFPTNDPAASGFFASDLRLGGFRIERWQAPVLIGTLTVDTSSLAPGTYTAAVGARTDRELEAALTPISKVTLGIETEPLTGTADIIIADDGGPGDTPADRDGDGVIDADDAFPDDPTETVDTDGDGIGDNADLDDDGDGVPDVDDPTPGGDPPSDGGDPGNGDGNDDGGSGNGGDAGDGGSDDPSGPGIGIPMCGAGMILPLAGMLIPLCIIRRMRRVA